MMTEHRQPAIHTSTRCGPSKPFSFNLKQTVKRPSANSALGRGKEEQEPEERGPARQQALEEQRANEAALKEQFTLVYFQKVSF